MKKLHSILALLLITICSMNFAACSDDDDDDASSSEIVGKWAFSDDTEAGFIFKQNGEFWVWEDGDEDHEGSYRVSGKKLILNGQEESYEFSIVELTATTLVLGGQDEDGYGEMELIRIQ